METNTAEDAMRSFVNLYLGEPFKQSGSRPKIDKVIQLKGGYRQGTIPSDLILFLTAGLDVQRGSAKDPANPARIEMEIVGHGARYRTWSIMYKVFEGAIDDAYDGAWEALSNWEADKGFEIKRQDGRIFTPKMIFIDSGDGVHTETVYRFVEQWSQSTCASKGFGALKRFSKDKGDEMTRDNFIRFRKKELGPNLHLVTISTNHYKAQIYTNLGRTRNPTGEQPAGFCDFPIDYSENYFKMLTAEEMRVDKSFHCPSGRRNEALDCRVLNLCAGDVFLKELTENYKNTAIKRNKSRAYISRITTTYMLNLLSMTHKPRLTKA